MSNYVYRGMIFMSNDDKFELVYKTAWYKDWKKAIELVQKKYGDLLLQNPYVQYEYVVNTKEEKKQKNNRLLKFFNKN
jgi:hypothetical protein